MAVYTAIDDPEAHFQAVTYTGNGSDDHAITFAGDTDMQPDLIWQKNIGDAVSHGVFDTLRGIGGGSNTKRLLPDNTNTEDDASNTVKSADSDGFTLGTNTNLNENNDSNVAWCWKANGSGSANTAGSIDTTATSANTTAGFSIVTWTGDENSSATLGHGLGAVPKFIITKGRT